MTVVDQAVAAMEQAKQEVLKLRRENEELVEMLKKMRSYFQSFVEDAVRPNEWIMKEWVAKCDLAIMRSEVGK